MRPVLLFLFGLGLLALAGPTFDAVGQVPEMPEQKFGNFERLVKGAKEYDGLFKLHQKDEHLYCEIPQHQFEKPMLCPIAIARGMAMGGFTLNFDEQWVLYFKRVGDKVQLVRRNVHFKARSGSPLAKAVETTYTDSVLLALRIQALNMQRNSVVIDLNDVFMSDFAQLGIGHFDSNRSSWHKIKAFPQNLELEVMATYSGGGRGGMSFFGSDDSVIDSRGTTVVIHYGLSLLPDGGYQPRFADDRVGHFLSVVKDFSSDSRDSSFLRYVNRWRLERAENDSKSKDKLSAPKKKIVFWIEKSVPDEYRAFVREGILEWNKAFEKIGFRDAIEVRQQENEDFDPEDINYNTFRWITTDAGFAMGPSRVNPLTGEILDADIIFDASMVRFWKNEQATLLPNGQVAEEPASLIQAAQQGLDLGNPRLLPLMNMGAGWNEPHQAEVLQARQRMRAARQGICQCCNQMKYELGMAAMALAERDALKPGEKVPEELIGQAIKEVTMHEVGHTLGLRHNFKASTMLKNEQLHDTNVTRKQGLVGSVMDYAPVNLAPKGVKQGDYFTTTIGPYDYWAIEYAYKPLSGGADGELEELSKIGSKCATPGLDYATDEDLRGAADPLVNVWDLGADPMKFGQDRMLLAEELLKNLADKSVDKGEGYQRTRVAFGMLLGQYGNAAHLISRNIGGEHMYRDHAGDPNGRDPFIPVKAAKQREALKFLQEHILSDKAFQFSPQLLRRLAADRWLHWGNEGAAFGGVDYPVDQRVLNIQRIVLNHVTKADVLARIQNNALKAEKEEPLTLAEVFRSVSDGVWSDLPGPNKPDPKMSSSVIRRNLQREHLKGLSELVLGKKASNSGSAFVIFFGSSKPVPPDARSLARMHLRELQRRIAAVLGDDKIKNLDDTTRAHLEECQERVAKVLNAAMQVNE
jgi:hypothetical protein